MKDWKEIIQNNRIRIITIYETKIPPEDREDVANMLYKYFLQGITKGQRTIKLRGEEIDVCIEDYEKELIEKLERNISLDYEKVELIAKELNKPEVLTNWVKNREYYIQQLIEIIDALEQLKENTQ